ncbi:MAG: peptidoglycan-associated lipoprotein Pal [Gemmatimonadota bacterium]
MRLHASAAALVFIGLGAVACGGQAPPPAPPPVTETARDTAAERRAAEEAERARLAAEASRLCEEAQAAMAAGNFERARSLYGRAMSDYAGTDCANSAQGMIARIDAIETIREQIHFEFDKSAITDEAAAILQRKADVLRRFPNLKLTLEGHCDERGSLEYNQALGQRRAESTKRYLVSLGLADAMFETVSYGEERPVAQGHTEEAWAANRRSEFVIQNMDAL